MFVRFRQQPNKLQVSLVKSNWNGGKLKQEHIAGLGSVPLEPTVPDRARFWKKLFEKLSALSNRIDQEMHGKILDSISKRIPVVTEEELRAYLLEYYDHEKVFWEAMECRNDIMGADYTLKTGMVMQKAVDAQDAMRRAMSQTIMLQEKIERISRGELPPELPVESDTNKLLADSGISKRQDVRWRKRASMTVEEYVADRKRALQKLIKAMEVW